MLLLLHLSPSLLQSLSPSRMLTAGRIISLLSLSISLLSLSISLLPLLISPLLLPLTSPMRFPAISPSPSPIRCLCLMPEQSAVLWLSSPPIAVCLR